MELIQIYQCFCDATRLRIIHLLTRGPLCVCHFQEILGIAQTKVSQHLAYLRKKGMVECTRHGTWMIYSLPVKTARSSSKPISNASKTVRLPTSGSVLISRLLRRCELTADGLMKPSKTNAPAPAKTP